MVELVYTEVLKTSDESHAGSIPAARTITRVYGPYIRKDKRKVVIIHYDDGSKTTKQWARHLLELHIGRELTKDETVDHIDNDFTNDAIDNLQILTRAKNAGKGRKPAEMWEFNCPVCNKRFEIIARQVRHNQRNHKKDGPFCSRSCAGKWSVEVGKLHINR